MAALLTIYVGVNDRKCFPLQTALCFILIRAIVFEKIAKNGVEQHWKWGKLSRHFCYLHVSKRNLATFKKSFA